MSSPTLMLTAAAGDAERAPRREDESLDRQRAALERFLAGVERRAFRMTRLAVRDTDDALDIVQDAMLRLVRHYAGARETEWQLLFYRILQNRIRDHQRRGGVRRRVLALFAPAADDEEPPDPFALVPGPSALEPESAVTTGAAMAALEGAVARLPARQREAFLLRTIEGLDVAATAAVMGCSEGSVKTHHSRAVRTLRTSLDGHL
jgi:RNA polymerase sigma-70 factor (ECF subfamily)